MPYWEDNTCPNTWMNKMSYAEWGEVFQAEEREDENPEERCVLNAYESSYRPEWLEYIEWRRQKEVR